MNSYSIKGYELAIRLRSAKTILVEGVTDKRIINRLMLEHQVSTGSRSRYVVDEVGIVSDDLSMSGKGNKEKIQILALALKALGDKLNWLIDREWDGVDLDNIPEEVAALVEAGWGYRTKGHSIENYSFDHQILSDFIRMFYGSELPADYFTELDERFESMLRLATAYSISAKKCEVLKKCGGLISANYVSWVDHGYAIVPAFNAALAARNASVDLVACVWKELSKLQKLRASALQWLCHGHLGEEMVCACAAHLAMSYGCSTRVVESIERGLRSEKQAHHADCLARLGGQDVEPLDKLIMWAQ